MTAERERQRERLTELLRRSGHQTNVTLADFLLDNGVTVEVPEPVIAPGTTGRATVSIAPFPSQQNRGIVALNDDGDPWFHYVDQNGYAGAIDFDRVTDFIPDPEPLTAEAVDRIARTLAATGKGQDSVRHVLAPYVAKGGA